MLQVVGEPDAKGRIGSRFLVFGKQGDAEWFGELQCLEGGGVVFEQSGTMWRKACEGAEERGTRGGTA